MEENVKRMLDGEIEAQINIVAATKSGTKERSEAIDDLKQLYQLRIEEEKLSLEHLKVSQGEDKCERDKRERAANRERTIRLIIAGGEVVLPLIFYGVWMACGFKFEEKGTITSPTFKNLINRFKPTK